MSDSLEESSVVEEHNQYEQAKRETDNGARIATD